MLLSFKSQIMQLWITNYEAFGLLYFWDAIVLRKIRSIRLFTIANCTSLLYISRRLSVRFFRFKEVKCTLPVALHCSIVTPREYWSINIGFASGRREAILLISDELAENRIVFIMITSEIYFYRLS